MWASTREDQVTNKAPHTTLSTPAHLFIGHVKNTSSRFDLFTDRTNQPRGERVAERRQRTIYTKITQAAARSRPQVSVCHGCLKENYSMWCSRRQWMALRMLLWSGSFDVGSAFISPFFLMSKPTLFRSPLHRDIRAWNGTKMNLNVIVSRS